MIIFKIEPNYTKAWNVSTVYRADGIYSLLKVLRLQVHRNWDQGATAAETYFYK